MNEDDELHVDDEDEEREEEGNTCIERSIEFEEGPLGGRCDLIGHQDGDVEVLCEPLERGGLRGEHSLSSHSTALVKILFAPIVQLRPTVTSPDAERRRTFRASEAMESTMMSFVFFSMMTSSSVSILMDALVNTPGVAVSEGVVPAGEIYRTVDPEDVDVLYERLQ